MSHPFDKLSPEVILGAVESLDFTCDARLLALNSYENRVYQVGIEEQTPLIVKFYRPDRWSDDAILEEHAFSLELADCEVPVVAPLVHAGQTLFQYAGFRFALFPRRGGYAPEPGDLEQLYRLGQLLGRAHQVGSQRAFLHRETIDPATFGHASLAALLQGDVIPSTLLPAYRSTANDLLAHIDQRFAALPYQGIRLHGDCHPGNLLCRDETYHIVDLDDCRMGPAVQDLWMLLVGDRQAQLRQVNELIEGYQQFYDFNAAELGLIEALRGLRLLQHSAWLARRWDDPAFPRAFPWFTEAHYWSSQVTALRGQLAALEEEPLRLF